MASSGAGSVPGLAVSQPRRVGPVLADRRELRVQRRVHPGDGDLGGIGGRAQPGGGRDGQGVRQIRRQDTRSRGRPPAACRVWLTA